MASRRDVERIARSLPEVEGGGLTFGVAGKAICWPWMERIQPKKARVPNLDVLAVRVANELDKQSLLGLDPKIFFTEPHYDGYPAVLVRLRAIDVDLLEQVLTDAWRIRAPRRLAKDGDER